MFSMDGFFSNILAEIIGVFASIAVTLVVVNWWLERKERLKWRPVQIIGLKGMERIAEVLARMDAAARNYELVDSPMSTLRPHFIGVRVTGDFSKLHQSIDKLRNDPQWPKAINEAAKGVSEELLRFPVVAARESSFVVDLERLQNATARWEEFATYVQEHGSPDTLIGEDIFYWLDGTLAQTEALDLAIGCIERARKARDTYTRPGALDGLKARLRRIRYNWKRRRQTRDNDPKG